MIGDNDFVGRKKAVDCENYSKSKTNEPSGRSRIFAGTGSVWPTAVYPECWASALPAMSASRCARAATISGISFGKLSMYPCSRI